MGIVGSQLAFFINLSARYRFINNAYWDIINVIVTTCQVHGIPSCGAFILMDLYYYNILFLSFVWFVSHRKVHIRTCIQANWEPELDTLGRYFLPCFFLSQRRQFVTPCLLSYTQLHSEKGSTQ